MTGRKIGLCGCSRKMADHGLAMISFLTENGRHSAKLVTMPSGRHRAVGIMEQQQSTGETNPTRARCPQVFNAKRGKGKRKELGDTPPIQSFGSNGSNSK